MFGAKIVATHALMGAIPSLDLVLTPNGFGIVNTTNIAPASKDRVERLIASMEGERDDAIEMLLVRLKGEEGWLETPQASFFAQTLFPNLSLCRRLAIRQHLWTEYQQLQPRLVKIENVLAETYFSQEQMQVFRNIVISQQGCHRLQEQVIRSLQSLELMLLSDMQVHPQSFFDLVNIIREHEDIFPEWHASPTAKLYSPAVYQNKKESPGYWF